MSESLLATKSPQVIIWLAVILGFIFILRIVLNKFPHFLPKVSVHNHLGNLKIVQKISFGRQSDLIIIQWYDVQYLLSVTHNNVQLIAHNPCEHTATKQPSKIKDIQKAFQDT